MSNFSLLVAGENPEELMAPYQEFLEGVESCHKKYLTFVSVEDECKNEWEKNEIEIKSVFSKFKITTSLENILKIKNKESVRFKQVLCDLMFLSLKDNDVLSICSEEINNEEILVQVKNVIKTGIQRFDFDATLIEQKETKIKEYYETFENFIESYYGHNFGQSEKKYGYWKNQNAKWNWYELGGKWKNSLKLRKEFIKKYNQPLVSQAIKCEIDFDGMAQDNFEKRSKIYDEFEEKYNNIGSSDISKVTPMAWNLGIKNISKEPTKFIPQSRTDYLKENTGFRTFAVLKDDKWHESNKIDGHLDENKEWVTVFNEIMKQIPEKTLISIFDCHI